MKYSTIYVINEEILSIEIGSTILFYQPSSPPPPQKKERKIFTIWYSLQFVEKNVTVLSHTIYNYGLLTISFNFRLL